MTEPHHQHTARSRRSGGAAVVSGLLMAAATAQGQVRLSHHDDGAFVVIGTGIVCAAGEGTNQTSLETRWSQAFTLSRFGVTEDLEIHTVEFGVETIRLATLPEAEIAIDLYQIPAGSPPLGAGSPDRVRIGSTTVTFSASDLPAVETVFVPVSGVVEADAALMVEVSAPDFEQLAGGRFGDFFLIGGAGNPAFPEFYLTSPPCGVLEPTSGGVLCAFGSDCDALIIAEGRLASVCRADLDRDGELTIFDFLAFQNAFDAGCP